MSVRIIVDSAADMPEKEKSLVTVVPLSIFFGSREYTDGVDICHREFYEKLVESDTLPSTSQPSPGAFEAVYGELCAAGDTAVVLTLSSKLSGTYQSACIAAEDYKGKIFVVDTENVSITEGILAKRALQLRDEGLGAEEIFDILEREKKCACLIAMLDTLEYLKKGGRISKTAAVAGGILNIKPVITIKDGEIAVLGKARGSKQGNNMLVSELEKSGGIDFSMPILLGYTGLSDALLNKYVEDSSSLWREHRRELNSTLIG
ncbi:MAG: DegV family protein, partial [Oscillospiraceae bacterium]|nr:DegV family protein [Oscillospiraceae bacterium]